MWWHAICYTLGDLGRIVASDPRAIWASGTAAAAKVRAIGEHSTSLASSPGIGLSQGVSGPIRLFKILMTGCCRSGELHVRTHRDISPLVVGGPTSSMTINSPNAANWPRGQKASGGRIPRHSQASPPVRGRSYALLALYRKSKLCSIDWTICPGWSWNDLPGAPHAMAYLASWARRGSTSRTLV